MTAADIARVRLRMQRLTGAGSNTPEEVVGWLGAVQSQELALAKWSVGARTRRATAAQLDLVLADGSILRTHVLRPTWHFVLPADIGWMLELTAPRVRRMMAHYDRQLELDGRVYAMTNRVIARAVATGGHLTRAELSAALRAKGVEATGQRLGHIVLRAELDRVVCSGVPTGRQQTYAPFEERTAPAAPLDREEAAARLAVRYFTSHAPATARDFSWWSSLPASEARRAIEASRERLHSIVADGVTYWSAGAMRPPASSAPRARLLQAYDEYIVAYGQSRGVIDLAGLGGPSAKGAVSLAHWLVIDGQLAGRWRLLRAKAGATVEIRLLRSLDAAEDRALEEEVRRFGRFMQLPVRRVVAQSS